MRARLVRDITMRHREGQGSDRELTLDGTMKSGLCGRVSGTGYEGTNNVLKSIESTTSKVAELGIGLILAKEEQIASSGFGK